MREGEHDLIVTGTSQARGPLRHYIMGDLTRGILNRADCPVLVARAGKIVDDEDAEGGFFYRLTPRLWDEQSGLTSLRLLDGLHGRSLPLCCARLLMRLEFRDCLSLGSGSDYFLILASLRPARLFEKERRTKRW